MAEDHGAEPVGCGTKGEAHAKLAGLLRDRRGHNAVEADCREQHSREGKGGQEQRVQPGLGKLWRDNLVHRSCFHERSIGIHGLHGIPDRRKEHSEFPLGPYDQATLREALPVRPDDHRSNLTMLPEMDVPHQADDRDDR